MKITVILCVITLSACGMRGDLYLPDDEPEKSTGNSGQTIRAKAAPEKTDTIETGVPE
jgi:predicted small lipoprotein YifL